MAAIRSARIEESRPDGGWDVLSIGAFDAMWALMDQAQKICAARTEFSVSLFGAGEAEGERWLAVSRRISGWRTTIHPENHEAVDAARVFCSQVIDDYATVRPLYDALAGGRARSLTPDAAAVTLDGRWWIARDDRYVPLDPADTEQAALIARFERHAARLDEPAREEAEPVAGSEQQREDGER
ncbi:hypothetical protein OIE63_39940 (plasmid) [Streptomyces sp. NBC_01795]|uniref:hypothetical protein n=1 Tax=unclassified Streptomyces TaxID=2593676 RepID=UPI002DD8A21D|nr:MULTISPECIES: hypothetical protein [unclassified Streptomyces]WSA97678.1 hypothetical protein OIE63_39940 [Streptomyces sp. NBC_01795]WSB82071.1 hypothetical protein OHB04_40870 [Streptomyces sp. NBC_01775]WSS18044.1 hypothetical protein OG533_39955 [Streptomyces sp. NBC_01186]